MIDTRCTNMAYYHIVILMLSFVAIEPPKYSYLCVSRDDIVNVHLQQSTLGMCTTINYRQLKSSITWRPQKCCYSILSDIARL